MLRLVYVVIGVNAETVIELVDQDSESYIRLEDVGSTTTTAGRSGKAPPTQDLIFNVFWVMCCKRFGTPRPDHL